MAEPFNSVPSHIVVHGNCVDCGRPAEVDPTPFTKAAAKPLAPGNTRLRIELPAQAQHKSPERCESCKLAYYVKWQSRKQQLPWLVALVVGVLVLTGWLLWK